MIGPTTRFRMNASNINPIAHLINVTEVQRATVLVSGIIQRILTSCASSDGSQLYEIIYEVYNTAYGTVPLKKGK